MSKAIRNIIVITISIIVGLSVGFLGVVYYKLPQTEELIVGEQTFYSSTPSSVSSNPIAFSSGELSIHFLELGNKYTGDSTYIKLGDLDILIDCGSKTNSISTVTNYINQYVTDNTLEYVIVTHAHTDHFAGFATSQKMDSIFDLYTTKNIIDFGSGVKDSSRAVYSNYVRERDAEISAGANYIDASLISANNNKIIELAPNFTLEILYNQFYTTKNSKNENNYSVCTLFTYFNQHFLFTGDLEKEGEELLVQNNVSIQKQSLPEGVELYKAGHHGSATSSSQILLENIHPQHVCVCCCAGSSEYTTNVLNQFPTQDFINRVAQYTDEIYVTTLCLDYDAGNFTSFNGNIIIITDGNNFSLKCTYNTTKLKDTDWFKQYRTWPTS